MDWSSTPARTPARYLILAALALASVVLLLTAPVVRASSANTKPFAVTLAGAAGAVPAAVAAGQSGTVTATVRNLSTSQTLGSANLTVPSGFQPTAATTAVGTAAISGSLVKLRSIAVAPGAAVSVAITLTAPASSVIGSCAPKTYTWPTPAAKQSNDFNGTGNDFSFTASSSELRTVVNARCLLRFTTQPADAEPGAAITSAAYDPSAAPVGVEIVDAAGQRVRCVGARITLGLTGGQSLATLSGATSVTTSSGVATFPGISVDLPGTGYALTASAPGVTSATSGAFRIQPSTFAVVVADHGGATPATVPTGTQRTLDVTYTNLAGGRTLGSSDLALPVGLSLVAATSPAGTATVAGNTVQLRALALAPGASVTVTVTVTAPCASAAQSLTWPSPVARSSADFLGPVAFTLAPGASSLATSVTGSCALAFVAQPSTADPGAAISSAPYDPSGAPVSVEVRDADGNRVTASSTTIQLAIGANPSSGTLAGFTIVQATAGLARFPGISIDQAGSGYTLRASAADSSATSATSDPFLVESSTFGVSVAGPGSAVPSAIPAGQREDLVVSVSNRTGGRTLGSTNLVVPAGLTLVSAASSTGTATVSGDTVQLRGLALAPGAAAQATVRVEAACATQPLTWATPAAKSSPDFSGPAEFALDSASSSLTTSITGACTLHFVTPPAAASAGATITGTPNDPSGPPVQVEILGGDGQRVASSSATVTITLAPGGGPGTLSGTTTQPASSGLATFSDLSIDQPGSYAFTASSTVAPPITIVAPPVTSPPFSVSGLTVSCPEDVTCSGTLPLSTPGSNVKVTAIEGPTSDTDTGQLTLSLGTGGNLDCALYTEVTSPQDIIAVDYNALDRQKTVATTLPKSAITPFMWHDDGDADDIAFLQDCFGAPYRFAVRIGTPLQANTQYVPGPYPAPEYKGLLPDCGGPARLDNPATPAIDGAFVAHAGAPCVQSRVRTAGGGATITSLWPSGRELGSPLDPRGRS